MNPISRAAGTEEAEQGIQPFVVAGFSSVALCFPKSHQLGILLVALRRRVGLGLGPANVGSVSKDGKVGRVWDLPI